MSARAAPSGGDATARTATTGLTQSKNKLQRIQRAVGNLAAGRLLSGVLQAKLRIGAAGDAHEREADRMADKVLRMPTAGDGGMIGRVSDVPVQRVCSECDDELQRQPLEEEEEEELAQRVATSADGGGEAPSSVQSQISTLRGRGQPLSPSLRSFFEPRFNHDFGGVRVHTGSTAAASAQSIKARAFTVGRDIAFNAGQYAPQSRSGRRLLAHELTHVVQQTPLVARRTPLIQRQPEPAAQQEAPAPEPEQSPATPEAAPVAEEGAASEATPAPGLLVEDGESELGPGQLTKSTFLAELRTGICSAADTELADTAFSAQGCPTIELYLRFYEALSAARIEQDLVNYVPEAAGVTDARQYIPFAAARVQRSVASWVQTGEITGVPEGLPTGLPGLSALSGVLFKARPGGPRGNANPVAVQTQLGAGRPLNSTVNSRMGSAFGRSFSNVRVHTDSTARQLNSRHNARAFTVGNHVAFGAGEYRPGTIIGDALIAHELAHTVQQRNTASAVAPLEMGSRVTTSLEQDADRSAVGVVASLWGKGSGAFEHLIHNSVPTLRSGLSLQRCSSDAEPEKSFAAYTSDEQEALDRMRQQIDASGRLLQDPSLSEDERRELEAAVNDARAALRDYRDLREQGGTRVAIMAPVGVASAGIVGDDVTGVGVADDVLLIPLALIAIATLILTNPPPSGDAVGDAWAHLGRRIGDLGNLIETTILMTAAGNVVHDHIVEEAKQLAIALGLAASASAVTREILCEMLRRLATQVRRSDTDKWKKIISTMKGLGCRRSRAGR